MLNSLEIFYALNELGISLEPGKYEPSYASEHALGNGKYLYVKRKGEQPVGNRPLVLPPETLSLRERIDAIPEFYCRWEKTKNSSFRRFPKDGQLSQYGYDADVGTVDALKTLVDILQGTSANAPSVSSQKAKEKTAMFPLNQILYGPPGTGKTYSTTALAVEIADEEWFHATAQALQGDGLREAVRARYQSLIEKQRIMFTTFHQSFSYEDFIEGIRAVTDENTGALRYEVVDGIFKQLCLNAKVKVQGSEMQSVSLTGRRIWKMSLGNTMEGQDDVYEECLANNVILLGWGEDIDFSDCPDYQTVKTIIDSQNSSEAASSYMGVAVNTFKNIMRNGDIVIVSDGNNKFRAIAEITGDYQYKPNDERDGFHQMRPVKWLRTYTPSLPREQIFLKSLSQMTLYELRDTTIDRNKLEQLLAPVPKTEATDLPHILIIDEINRGNIARIFGELITLLESDKRAGKADERTLMLPYSKQLFSVPGNVYVIGTMNTADKSLIQMDLALRRRFSFVEMLPQPELLQGVTVFGVDISRLLARINQRIEALLDSEHMIGHAYFMSLTTISNIVQREAVFAAIFRDKILPLLREYFFDDYERVGWVLNDPVKAREHQFIWLQNSHDTPSLEALFPASVAGNLVDRRFRINPAAFNSAAAYQGIL